MNHLRTALPLAALACSLAFLGCDSNNVKVGSSFDRGTHTQAPGFGKEQLTLAYHSEGACVGDFDNNGSLDIASGPYWYAGPTFTTRVEIATPVTFAVGGYADAFFHFAEDIDLDGWTDIVSIDLPGSPAVWARNNQGGTGHWTRHLIWPRIDGEAPMMVDVDGDGQRELLALLGVTIGYLERNTSDPTSPWTAHTIQLQSVVAATAHGMGTGDVNLDGRLDVVVASGWLEQPASLAGDPIWTFHPFRFATPGGAQMFVYDVDGDGDNDVITSLNGHGYGLSWFEQIPAGASIDFVEHVILPTDPLPGDPNQFSQLHAMGLADVTGDGLSDIVTGKTWLAHNGIDPGNAEPPVLFVFRLDRNGSVRFVPECIDDASGVGRQIAVEDIDGDSDNDVVSANKNGVFVFRR